MEEFEGMRDTSTDWKGAQAPPVQTDWKGAQAPPSYRTARATPHPIPRIGNWLVYVFEATRETLAPRNHYPHLAEFHLDFWRQSYVQLMGAVLPFSIAFSLLPSNHHRLLAMLAAAKFLFGCLWAAFAAARFYPVQVGAAGIRARNPAGIAYRLLWSDISSVTRLWWCPGARYLRVSTPWKVNTVWIPLFLVDLPAFKACICEHAPAGNPLREYFERGGG